MKWLISTILLSLLFYSCTDHTEEGKRYFDQGDYQQALSHFNEDLALKPSHPMRLYNVARCYEELGRYDQAILLLDKGIEQDPKFIEAYMGRGRCYYKKGAYNFALMDFASVTSLDKENAEPFYLAGLCYLKDSIFDEAAVTFNKALKINPDYHIARYNKAIANVSMSNVIFALRDFNYLIREKQLLKKCYFNRGYIYEDMNIYASAIHDYSKAIEMGYVNERILTRRASCYLKSNLTTQACKDFHSLSKYNNIVASNFIREYCSGIAL